MLFHQIGRLGHRVVAVDADHGAAHDVFNGDVIGDPFCPDDFPDNIRFRYDPDNAVFLFHEHASDFVGFHELRRLNG
jgi:hypothetical protein